MADKFGRIVNALYSDIYTQSESTGVFPWLSRHCVYIMPPQYISDDLILSAPFCLIYPQQVRLTPANMSCYRSDEKSAGLTVSVFANFDDPTIAWKGVTGRTGLKTMAEAFETRYNRNTLSITGSSLQCFLRSIDYAQERVKGFFQFHLALEYQYLDERND